MKIADDIMALVELVEEHANGDLVREMRAFAAERIMVAYVEAWTRATKGVRTTMRVLHCNGARDCNTRAGRIALNIPKLRKGSYFPSSLEPRRTSEYKTLAVNIPCRDSRVLLHLLIPSRDINS